LISAHRNPFRVSKLESLNFCFPPGFSWDLLEEKLEKLGGRGAIVGAHGTGKTTLLEEWIRRWEGRGKRVLRTRLSRENAEIDPLFFKMLTSCGPKDTVIIDGVDELGMTGWHRLRKQSRGAGRLIVSSHRIGRLPLLFRTGTTPELAEKLLLDLLPDAETRGYLRFLPHLLRQYRGNLREVLFHCYDLEAGRKNPGGKMQEN